MNIANILVGLGVLVILLAAGLAGHVLIDILRGSFLALAQEISQLAYSKSRQRLKRRAAPKASQRVPLQELEAYRSIFIAGVAITFLGLALHCLALMGFTISIGSVMPSRTAAGSSFLTGWVYLAGIGALLILSPLALPQLFGKDLARASEIAGVISCLIAVLSYVDDHSGKGPGLPLNPLASERLKIVTVALPPPEKVDFQMLQAISAFPSGSFEPTGRMLQEICSFRRTIAAMDVAAVVVLARHDNKELKPDAKKTVHSNYFLAQARADAVRAALMLPSPCPSPIPKATVALATGPSHMGPKVSEDELTQDRTTDLFILKKLP